MWPLATNFNIFMVTQHFIKSFIVYHLSFCILQSDKLGFDNVCYTGMWKVKSMKIVTLIENTTADPELEAEHGLSLYIEACGRKILFDAGESGAAIRNAERLGIDLTQVDTAVLSHGHSDHCGGFTPFLHYNDKAPIWVRPEARLSYHNASGTCISMDPELKYSPRLCLASDKEEIAPGLTLYSCNDREKIVPIDSAGLLKWEKGTGNCYPDDFLHEQYLLIEEEGKRVLISGCSHKGILNLAHWFRPDVLIGGFHYMRVDPTDPMLERAAGTLLGYPTVYYTGHCTGAEQFSVMKKKMADRLHYLSTGTTRIL